MIIAQAAAVINATGPSQQQALLGKTHTQPHARTHTYNITKKKKKAHEESRPETKSGLAGQFSREEKGTK
jgi:hypothetical protein